MVSVAKKSVLIEVDDAAAGVLVEGERGFIFHSVHPSLNNINGKKFSSVQAAQNAARDGLKQMAEAS
jgi:hypothetical protein